MSVALLGTSFGIYRTVQRAFDELVRSQALALLGSVRDHLRLASGEVDAAALDELLGELHDRGLRHISLGDGVLTSGQATITHPIAGRGRLRLAIVGSRARITARQRRPRWGRWRPPAPPVQRLLRSMTLELEPTLALRMRAQAQRSLGISAIVASLMIGLALIAARWTRRRQELEQQLEARRRLAALGQMSAVLAHEIRNPLASLKGHAQLLEELLEASDAKTSRKAGQVVHEAQRLEALTNELLEFVRTGAIELSAAAPLALVEEVAAEHAERVEIEDRGAPDEWPLDADRMRRALRNLLDNALQASPEGAIVTIAVAQQAGGLAITVRDRGGGVPPGEEEAIFEPFHTKRSRGTGLGLAVARQIVEAHGGTLTARNEPGGGACFSVLLPARPARPGSGA